MFFTISYTAHVLISIFLHFCGISFGLYWWRLFPKNPVRYITKMPEQISLMIENVDEEAEYLMIQEEVTANVKDTQIKRHFG